MENNKTRWDKQAREEELIKWYLLICMGIIAATNLYMAFKAFKG